MNIADFLDYLLGRDATRDLAVQLVAVYEGRGTRVRAVRANARG